VHTIILLQAVGEYSSDAMRWALADAGDGMDDANFETTTANAAILRLTKELAWIEEVLAPGAGEVSCKGPLVMSGGGLQWMV
jgi:leucyl-tRNA synthetase